MKAKSIHGKTPTEITQALEQSLSDGYSPTLAIVFISIKQDRKAVTQLLATKNIDVLGATSCGEFIDGHESKGGIAILLMDLAPESFSILFQEIGDGNVSIAGQEIGKRALQEFENPAMILCSTGFNTKEEYLDGETLVASIEKVNGPQRIFFGGMAGDDLSLSGTYVFTSREETDFGIVALVMDEEKIQLEGMAITGWKPLGMTRTVTKSKDNLVYTIDDKPAVEMYYRYLGKKEKTGDQTFKVREELGMHYPFIVERGTGGTILKTPMQVDYDENALVMDLPIEEGTKLWFSMPPDFDIVENILEQAEQLKNSSKFKADALLIFSCAGRVDVLGPLTTSENEGLHDIWNAPMAGFFTYGEYGRALDSKQEFHSGACCWVALKERLIS